MKISVVIATYGVDEWKDIAWSRAYPSAINQGAHEVLIGHDAEGTIATVRNGLAEEAEGTYLCVLDADDELAPGYITAMTHAWREWPWPGDAEQLPLLTPRVSYVNRGRAQSPKFWPEKPLWEGNWLVIGTLVPRTLFLEVGGFPEAIHGYEDWALFAKCSKAGSPIVKVPEAIYRAHVRSGSRNRSLSHRDRVYWHYTIGREVFPEHYPPEWLERELGKMRPAMARRGRGR